MKSLIGKKRFLFVIGIVISVAVVAYAADFDVTLPDTDGTSAFEVLDSGSTSLMRFGSDGGATIGDGGGAVAINSSDWDISTTGDMTGIGAITADGTITANGTLDANGTVTIGDGGDTVAIDSSDWDISTTGDMTGIGAITTDGTVTFGNVTDGLVKSDSSGNLSTQKMLVGTVVVGDVGDSQTDLSLTVGGDITSATKTTDTDKAIVTVNFSSLGDTTYAVSMMIEGTNATKDADNDLEEPIIYDKTATSFTVYLDENLQTSQSITLNFIIIDF